MEYIIYFIITISVLVFVHEFGHFIAAKLSKMRVDVFSIGFNKRLLGYNKITGFSFGSLPKDFQGEGHTDYRICLIPLGGYVKIAGMVDESVDVAYAQSEPQPWEFRSKSTIAKLFVITAGVLMNLLLAFVIFAGSNYLQPRENVKTTTIGYVAAQSPAEKAGLRTNDKILNVNGVAVNYWDEVVENVLIRNMGKSFSIKLSREGKEITLSVPKKTFPSNLEKEVLLFPDGYITIMDSVLANTPAAEAKIKAGDVVLSLNGQHLANSYQLTSVLSSYKEKPLPFLVKRGKDTLELSVVPNAAGKIGVIPRNKFTGKVEYRSNGFFKSLILGANDIERITVLNYQMIKNVIMRNVEFKEAFGGPIKIAKYAAKTADAGGGTFLMFLGMLSLSLAIFNILPFPVLDGGHVIIILIEGIIKRELPLKLKIGIQNVGFALLILLMVFIVYNDIISL